ncbi:MAG: capsule assembly Wzi family protein [Bacteroidota bacterium]
MNKNENWIKFFLLAILTSMVLTSKAQIDTSWHFSAETQVTASPAGKMPFWFRSGQYGNIPLSGTSGSVIGSVYKNYYGIEDGIDWSAGLQLRANLGQQQKLTILQGYIKASTGIFELSAGRTNDVYGIVDTALSSGSFGISGNALGIPKISLGIPNYYTLPFFNKLFAIKGNYAYGFFGDERISQSYALVKSATQYYQQNTLYVRLGREQWKLKLFGGINHNVMFGNEAKIYGPGWTLSPLKSTIFAAIGKTYYTPVKSDYEKFGGKVGNHVGSVDLGAQYDFEYFSVLGYHQIIYDVGAIAKLANISDGITGLSFTNKYEENDHINWHKFLIEFIYTKDQAGQFNSKSLSGDEDYYNDAEFATGWSYQGLNLGNPLLNSRTYTRDGLINDPNDYIINNRIMAIHTGFQGSVDNVQLTLKLTYSQNFGTYGTAIEGHSTGPNHFPPTHGLFSRVDQFSGYAEAVKSFYNGLSGGLAIGYDNGGLYNNTLGIRFKLRKTFN